MVYRFFKTGWGRNSRSTSRRALRRKWKRGRNYRLWTQKSQVWTLAYQVAPVWMQRKKEVMAMEPVRARAKGRNMAAMAPGITITCRLTTKDLSNGASITSRRKNAHRAALLSTREKTRWLKNSWMIWKPVKFLRLWRGIKKSNLRLGFEHANSIDACASNPGSSKLAYWEAMLNCMDFDYKNKTRWGIASFVLYWLLIASYQLPYAVSG